MISWKMIKLKPNLFLLDALKKRLDFWSIFVVNMTVQTCSYLEHAISILFSNSTLVSFSVFVNDECFLFLYKLYNASFRIMKTNLFTIL